MTTLRLTVLDTTLVERKDQNWTRLEGQRSNGNQIPIFIPGKLLHLKGKILDAKVEEKEGKQGKYLLVSAYTLVATPQAAPTVEKPTSTPKKDEAPPAEPLPSGPAAGTPQETTKIQKFRVLYLSYLKLAHDGLVFLGDKSAIAIAANGLMAAIERVPGLSQEGPKAASQYIGRYCKEYQEMFSHLSPLFDGDIAATAHATNGYMISFDRRFRHHLLSPQAEPGVKQTRTEAH